MREILGLMTCFNRKEDTINVITKLREGNPEIQFFFIITDDNSSDGTRSELEKIANVKVLEGSGRLFYSGGMRMAIAEALSSKHEYDYCLLFNDDVDFYDRAIEELTSKSTETIWVGPTCDINDNLSYGGIIKASSLRPKIEIVKADNAEGKECDTFNANCVLIPWNIFKNLDNIDTVYSHSLGDYDYGFSAKRKGFSIKVSNQFVGVCCDNPSKGSWRDPSLSRNVRIQKKEQPKGLPKKEWFYYLRKNYSSFTAVLYSIIPYLRILFKR